MSDIVAKIMVKVYLVSGRAMTHTYEAPKNDKDIKALIENIADRSFGLVRGETVFIRFENPSIS
ncbi:hypothetical protein ACFLUL_00100 [Chloroflexota bacterium]